MATSLTSSAVVGLPSIASPRSISSRNKSLPASSFLRGSGGSSSNALLRCSNKARVTCFARDWLRTDLTVIGFGLIGWLAPSSIPAINGESLTGLFFNSIGPELAHFPTGPALTSPFWLWMITWHLGLFITLTLGQIGFKGRGDGYF